MSDSAHAENKVHSENRIAELLNQLGNAVDTVEFTHVIEVINAHYDYTPTGFTNGDDANQAVNAAGTNEGSCKIFAFAQLHNLDMDQTLNCFGDYYRIDVLQNPDGLDHGNIRNFMRSGWAGIKFDRQPLAVKFWLQP